MLGWSVGGIIIHEVAQVLADRGLQLGTIAILDAYPSDAWRNREAPGPDATYKALLYIAGYDPDGLHDVNLSEEGVIGFLRRSGHALGELSDAQLQGVFHSVELNNRVVREHHHSFLDHPVLYFRAALDHKNDDLSPAMWAPWVSQLDVHDVPSLHAHLTNGDAMRHILRTLNPALNSAQSNRQEAECN